MNHDPRARLTTPLLLWLVLLNLAVADEAWNRFRGPNGSGVSHATTVPVSWSENDYNWVAELPGSGNSSPVGWGNRIFVTSADEQQGQRYLLCIEASSGSELWRRSFPFEPYRKHKNNSFASSTPAVDASHVYVLWQSVESSPLIALDHAGKQIWSYDLGPYTHGQGAATSPIVAGDQVVVCNDHKQGSFLLAVDRQTGQQNWKIPREGKRACYSTPCVYRQPGAPAELIFVHCFEGITGVDASTGEQKWSITPFGEFAQRALGSPIVIGDLIVGSSGAVTGEKNIVAIRPVNNEKGDVEVEEIYRVTRGAPHVPSPIAFDGLVFLWSDKGIVTCVDARTGQRFWQKRVGGNFFGSPICIDGKLYCVDLDGNVVVIAASKQYQQLARNALSQPSRATPAVVNGALLVRTESHLYSIGGVR